MESHPGIEMAGNCQAIIQSLRATRIKVETWQTDKALHLSWAKEALQPGSEVTIRILPDGPFAPTNDV